MSLPGFAFVNVVDRQSVSLSQQSGDSALVRAGASAYPTEMREIRGIVHALTISEWTARESNPVTRQGKLLV
jgi:hypothetical protein